MGTRAASRPDREIRLCRRPIERGFRLRRPRRFALGTRPARCRHRILRAGKTGTVFPPGGGGPDGDRHGYTGAAHRSGRRKACFFARNDEYGEAARRNEGRGPRKVPAAFGQSPKVPRPVAEGRQLFGERALPAVSCRRRSRAERPDANLNIA